MGVIAVQKQPGFFQQMLPMLLKIGGTMIGGPIGGAVGGAIGSGISNSQQPQQIQTAQNSPKINFNNNNSTGWNNNGLLSNINNGFNSNLDNNDYLRQLYSQYKGW